MSDKNKPQPTPDGSEQIQNPHDRFLKLTLEDPEKAKATLEGVLAPELFARLKLDTFQKEDTSYIDSKLKQYFSDTVYSCRTKDGLPVKITFLFEHKSYPPKYPHLQLLRYMLEVWDREAKYNQKLSLVLPILIYHGKEPWNYPLFKTYFSGKIDDDLEKFVPIFDFLVANFQETTYEDINQRFPLVSLRIAFRLMKSIRDTDLLEKLQIVFEGLSELEKDKEERKYFETIIVYLLYGSNTDINKVMENLFNISYEAGEFANSPAMQLIRRGREEGREEAKKLIEEARRKATEEERKKAIEEKKSAIRKMLKAEMPKAQIADFLGLSLKKLNNLIQKIQKEDQELQNGEKK